MNKTLRSLIKEEIKRVIKENEFKPSKKQKDIMEKIHEMTEHKKTGLTKYMFSVLGDCINMEYYHWTPEMWEKADKFFKAYEEALKEYGKGKEQKDQHMEKVKLPKK